METSHIIVTGAIENNLKNISLRIPKGKITVFTGVSGSGKSSLCLDTIAAESRRELNETFPSFVQQYLPKYGRPHVASIENLPVTILIDQKKPSGGARSTVATYTDIFSLLRLLFSRVGSPFVGYSDTFSFNHPSGSCPRCGGLGEIRELDIHKLVDFDKSLNDEDTIHYIAFGKGGWRWIRYAHSGLFDLDKKIKDYSPEELELFLNSPQIKLKNPPSNWPKSAKYEGLIPRMYRSIINSEEGLLHASVLNPMLTMGVCPDCKGTRLNERVRSCKINGLSLADMTDMSVSDAIRFVESIDHPLAGDIKKELSKRLQALIDIGLGYLTLGRGTSTLSGGEAGRIKIAKYINSALTDMVYVLDEPSAGLHPQDIRRLKESLLRLRDHGNTVLIVEHHREIIAMADHIVDMGPGAGRNGGRIMYEGDYEGLLKSDTVTGRVLNENDNENENGRTVNGAATHVVPSTRSSGACTENENDSDNENRGVQSSTGASDPARIPTGWLHIEHAKLHNLKDLTVDIPMGVLTVVAGVAGSGKSSLMEYFVRAMNENENTFNENENENENAFNDNLGKREVIFIGQKDIGINMRSTPATYLEISDPIRSLFAKANKVSQQLFSFNSKGACPACKGKGMIVSDMAFMESIETVCELCHGSRYNEEALRYRYKGKTISEVMEMSVDEALAFFAGEPFAERLAALSEVGLGYLHLNQSMSTLSGGELQRVKLADSLQCSGERKADIVAISVSQMVQERKTESGEWKAESGERRTAMSEDLQGNADKSGKIYIIDEPTDGLHLDDIRRLMKLFNRMTDEGNTLILIEHSTDVMRQADYLIELGPGGGDDGGRLLYAGPPSGIHAAPESVTRHFL